MAHRDVRAFPVRAVELGEQAGVGLHVVVEEQQQLPAGGAGADVARLCRAAVRLLDDGEREARIERAQGGGGAVLGAVVDDDHLEIPQLLSLEGANVAEDELTPPEGGDDDAEPAQGRDSPKRSSGVALGRT